MPILLSRARDAIGVLNLYLLNCHQRQGWKYNAVDEYSVLALVLLVALNPRHSVGGGFLLLAPRIHQTLHERTRLIITSMHSQTLNLAIRLF